MGQINNNVIKQYIEQYFEKIGLEEANDRDEFFKHIQAKYKIDLAQNLDMAMSLKSDTTNGKIYLAKNKDLQTSLDFGAYYYDLYKQFFMWLIKSQDLDNKKILDLGCDNGIVTCFLAKIYPNAKVVGIDKGKKGISCAKEIAEKLGLTNIEFEVLDAKKIDKFFKEEKFDVVISTRSLLEITSLPKIKSFWTIDDLEKSLVVANNVIKFFKSIEKIMKDDAKLITFERLSSFEDVLNFEKSMRESGLYIDTQNMYKVQFFELGDYEQMPIMIFDKTKADELGLYDFIEIYTALPTLNKQIDIEDDFAIDLEFKKIQNKELVFGTQIDYKTGVGSERREIWKTDDKFICYKYSNIGRRELITENVDKDQTIKDITNMANFIGRMGHKVSEYKSEEERNLIK